MGGDTKDSQQKDADLPKRPAKKAEPSVEFFVVTGNDVEVVVKILGLDRKVYGKIKDAILSTLVANGSTSDKTLGQIFYVDAFGNAGNQFGSANSIRAHFLYLS